MKVRIQVRFARRVVGGARNDLLIAAAGNAVEAEIINLQWL